jgi:hypothetical protein
MAHRVLSTGITTHRTSAGEIVDETHFVFIGAPNCPGSKRLFHKIHVKCSDGVGLRYTRSSMVDDNLYYDTNKNAEFLDGGNDPKDWDALLKMDIRITGGYWARLWELKKIVEDKPTIAISDDEMKRFPERPRKRQKPVPVIQERTVRSVPEPVPPLPIPKPVIKEPTAPSVPEPVPPLPIPTRFNIKYPKDGVLKVRLDKGRSAMVWIDTDASDEFERDNLFKFKIIKDERHVRYVELRGVRLKEEYPVSGSTKHYFFKASLRAKVGDKGTIIFSLERPATETEKHMLWTTFVRFEVVSSEDEEDDDCDPLCAIA